ncbi:hypothetical protein F5Y18DRAFT_173859 [Xylariaceae sp. FL1019]|nr:hypothetical protein F5Y18DRAFT_173859 [Xylariaceae sp. FL1019]
MSEIKLQRPSNITPGALDERPNALRRSRPPGFPIMDEDNKVPLRTEKSMKRESRIGLRGIFGRAKAGKNEKDVEDESSLRVTQRHAGIRASFAEFGNWPHKLQSSRSEASLISTPSIDSRPSSSDVFSPSRSRKGSSDADQFHHQTAAIWDPPPLFKVYPQAVKHATLPVCSIPVEDLARINDTKNAKLLQKGGKFGLEQFDGKSGIGRKKQRLSILKSSLDWTDKIFVLVTSGHLLQYAAEGSFHRTPERILQLTKSSAAYASDLIPGRHWVLQVASVTDGDGRAPLDPKPLRSRLSTKTNEKTQVSDMLLVFESPDAMDDWLAILRREIEALGGRRKLSETGKPVVENRSSKPQQSRRIVVTKDPHRFSRVITRDFSCPQDNISMDPMESDTFASMRRLSGYTIANSSPTASMISTDGQHLDNLRDSSSSHRFSYVSSGQRTLVTSAGSSPACSPTRESFSSQSEELPAPSAIPEVRLRPNAAAIVNRRQSMQALISTFESKTSLEASPRPSSNVSSSLGPETERSPWMSPPTVPNFSVPHTAGKRFSLTAPVGHGASHVSNMFDLDKEKSTKLARKNPPTALLLSRPLSIVIDQPSPRSPHSPNSMLSISIEQRHSSPVKDDFPLSVTSFEVSTKGNTEDGDVFSRLVASKTKELPKTILDQGKVDTSQHIPRSSSAMDSYGSRQRISSFTQNKDVGYKRASYLGAADSTHRHSLADINEWQANVTETPSLAPPPPICSPKRSAPSLRIFPQITPPPFLSVEAQAKSLALRRSMPQLADGPPPAPPPSYALPPIPKKLFTTVTKIKA